MSDNDGYISRRKFLKTSVAGTGVIVASSLAKPQMKHRDTAKRDLKKVPEHILGRTEEKVSLLGIGCFPFFKKEISIDDIGRILRRSLELGVNYLDVAPNYGKEGIGYAEEKMGPALEQLRKHFFLATKTEDPTYDGTWRLMEQSMKRMKTDYLDLVHLHNIGSESTFPDLKFVFSAEGAMGALRKAREQGVVRYIGASGHVYPTRFHEVIDRGEIDVLMLAVNFIIQHNYDFEHKVWLRAHKENLGLVAMKVLGGEKKDRTGICRIPVEYYDTAMRYALSLPGISCAVIGIKDIAQLERAADAVSQFKALTEEESYRLSLSGLELAQKDAWKAAYGKPIR